MVPPVIELTPRVLRNKGVPIEVAVLDPDPDNPEGRPIQRVDDDGNFVTRIAYLRADAGLMADIEDKYGSIDAFQQVLMASTSKAVRGFMALAMDLDEKAVGLIMLPGKADIEYATAVAGALALASGVDPTKLVLSLQSNAGVVSAASAQRQKQMDDLVTGLTLSMEDVPSPPEAPSPTTESAASSDSPGSSGTAPTADWAMTPPSSGL